MDQVYLVWAIKPGGGWISKSGNLTSDWKEAKRFTHAEAHAICKLRTNFGIGAFPVNLDHIEELAK